MILFKFKATPEIRDLEPGNTVDWPCKAFRWVIEISLDRHGFSFGLVNQHQLKSTGEWKSSHVDAYMINVTRHWAWGSDHFWYDGPHCLFSLGFIHVCWVNHACVKCLDS